MLRQWHPPFATNSLFAEESTDSDDIQEVYDVSFWDRNEPADAPTVGTALSPEERAGLDKVLGEFQDVLQSKPGRTKYKIRTKSSIPICLPPYRIPHAYRDIVKDELEQMEKETIIERSDGEWAFPIVLVKKKDGTLSMCVDYCRLNSIAEADAYPIPHVDDLIDSLGRAKYITTLDLAKGYWQVTVNEESRPRTAFATPYGLFQFRVMPFCLHGVPATF